MQGDKMKAIYKGLGTKNMANLAKGKEYHVRLSTGYQNGRHVIRLTLDDDSKCAYSSVQVLMKDWKIVEEESPAFMETLAARDARIEELWHMFGDIPMDPETEIMEEDFLTFPAGTHREEIWHWFDERYSKGVHELMFKG